MDFSGTGLVVHTTGFDLMGIDSGRRLFGQVPAQMMKQQSLVYFGFSNARQTEMAAVTQAEPDSTQDRAKALQGASRMMDRPPF